jgi:hypothetical protein
MGLETNNNNNNNNNNSNNNNIIIIIYLFIRIQGSESSRNKHGEGRTTIIFAVFSVLAWRIV